MNDFGSKIYAAAQKAVKEVYDLDVAEGQLVVETPQDTKLGDYSTSIAMKLSRTLRRNPMEIAEPLVAKLAELLPECESICCSSGSPPTRPAICTAATPATPPGATASPA